MIIWNTWFSQFSWNKLKLYAFLKLFEMQIYDTPGQLLKWANIYYTSNIFAQNTRYCHLSPLYIFQCYTAFHGIETQISFFPTIGISCFLQFFPPFLVFSWGIFLFEMCSQWNIKFCCTSYCYISIYSMSLINCSRPHFNFWWPTPRYIFIKGIQFLHGNLWKRNSPEYKGPICSDKLWRLFHYNYWGDILENNL